MLPANATSFRPSPGLLLRMSANHHSNAEQTLRNITALAREHAQHMQRDQYTEPGFKQARMELARARVLPRGMQTGPGAALSWVIDRALKHIVFLVENNKDVTDQVRETVRMRFWLDDSSGRPVTKARAIHRAARSRRTSPIQCHFAVGKAASTIMLEEVEPVLEEHDGVLVLSECVLHCPDSKTPVEACDKAKTALSKFNKTLNTRRYRGDDLLAGSVWSRYFMHIKPEDDSWKAHWHFLTLGLEPIDFSPLRAVWKAGDGRALNDIPARLSVAENDIDAFDVGDGPELIGLRHFRNKIYYNLSWFKELDVFEHNELADAVKGQPLTRKIKGPAQRRTRTSMEGAMGNNADYRTIPANSWRFGPLI